jgi:uncharacterized damage-inducible protein DinB
MKAVDPLTMLYNHHLWANLSLFEFCAALNADQLEATRTGAYGSIADMLQHIVGAEQSYFARINTGQSAPRRPDDALPLTMAEMIDSLRTTGNGLIEWASKVQADDTVQIKWRDGSLRDVPKTIILTQAINHGHEHREQIKAILTELGVEPPDLQGWVYFEEMDQ